jgi:light-regulated signal transduction histidine kinase (bacteriophytochrome)
VPVYEGYRLFAIVEFFAAAGEKPDAPFLEVMANIGKQLTAIVERKRLEQLLSIEMQNLSRSNAELQEFAKIAAHDLQEPLKSVQGFVDLLKRRYSDQLGDDGKRFIVFIDDAVVRMEQLIRGVLDHSKIRSQEKRFERTNLNAVVQQVKENLSVSIEQTGARINSDELPEIIADQLQMVQLFQNLLANALKFRNPDTAPEINISWRRGAEGEYQFSVKDNGIGMDSRYLNKIFGMFSRLNAKTEYPGTGIGLAICKKIVEHHGGVIWAESQLGKGSELCFSLPDETRR